MPVWSNSGTLTPWSSTTTMGSTNWWVPVTNWTTTTSAASTVTNWASWMNPTTVNQVDRSSGGMRPASPAARQALRSAERELELERAESAARHRAQATLLSLLSQDDREHYGRTSEVHVKGSAGGSYLIRHGYVQNVYQLNEDAPECTRLCAHPNMYDRRGQLPVEDAMIAQLLMLRFDEPGFLALANRSADDRPTTRQRRAQ